MFQHTAARRRLVPIIITINFLYIGFNTQPPEGGWITRFRLLAALPSFNTQPPEGGWGVDTVKSQEAIKVSTHSRPKAAGCLVFVGAVHAFVSTHSRPKAAGCLPRPIKRAKTRFNTQPPEGGWVEFQ